MQAIQAGNLTNELPDFATPSTAFAPVNSAFYKIITGTGVQYAPFVLATHCKVALASTLVRTFHSIYLNTYVASPK